MTIIERIHGFADAFERLTKVSLNPRRHTAANAAAHSRAVAKMAVRLASANGLSAAEVDRLEDLGLCHDIGKITGTAAPARSLDVLSDLGVEEPELLALVKWHDTSLPWWRSATRGQAPSDRAWRRLADAVDVRLLCLFMIADRVDAPGGWYRNAPTRWFLDQATSRQLVGELTSHLDDFPSEVSAGAALVRRRADLEVLLIRVRERQFELPKGGIEFDETAVMAARRELIEEAGAPQCVEIGSAIGKLEYSCGKDRRRKRVLYFAAQCPQRQLALTPPPETLEVRWVSSDELDSVPLVNEELRPIIGRALSTR